MNLKERIAAEKAALEKAKAALSEDDRAEIAMREELAQLQAQRELEERAKREVELERRLDSAREELGDEIKVKGVSVREFPDTFVIMRNGKAHAAWSDAISKAVQNKNADRAAIHRKYAIAVVYDWNGINDFETNAESTTRLSQFLTANPGIVTPITDAAAELAGIFAEERKS